MQRSDVAITVSCNVCFLFVQAYSHRWSEIVNFASLCVMHPTCSIFSVPNEFHLECISLTVVIIYSSTCPWTDKIYQYYCRYTSTIGQPAIYWQVIILFCLCRMIDISCRRRGRSTTSWPTKRQIIRRLRILCFIIRLTWLHGQILPLPGAAHQPAIQPWHSQDFNMVTNKLTNN